MRPEAEGPLAVGLAGRSPAWRAGLRRLLQDDYALSEAGSPGEALGLAGSCSVVVADEECAAALAEADIGVGLVVLSDEPALLQAQRPGAGFALIPGEASAEQVLAGVQAAAAGLVAFPVEAAAALLAEATETMAPPTLDEPLSRRELDVLVLLAEGMSNKRIARALAISDNTVKYHLAAVYGKLAVSSRAGAVRRGLELGLVKM